LNFDLTIEKVEDMFLLRRTKQNAAIGTYFYRFYFYPVKNVKYAIENFQSKKQIMKN
jgi:hypothetical protein